MALEGGHMQRRAITGIKFDANICTLHCEQLNNWRVPLASRLKQRRLTVRCWQIDTNTFCDEKLNRLLMAVLSSCMKSRTATGFPGVKICSVFDEQVAGDGVKVVEPGRLAGR